MEVTITLGPKAMEYVTGIPESELPAILSEVVERSLKEQVRPIYNPQNNGSDDYLIEQLKEIIRLNKINKSRESSESDEEYSFSSVKDIKITTIQSSADSEDDDFDFDLFKDLLK